MNLKNVSSTTGHCLLALLPRGVAICLFVGGEGREREGGVGYGIINSLLMLQARPPLLFHNVQKDVTKQYYLLLFLHSDWFILIVNWRRDI